MKKLRFQHLTRVEPTPADIEALAELRRRPAYHLCRIWLERLIANHDRPRTKTLRVGVESVIFMVHASFAGHGRGRPTITAALRDPEMGPAMIAAMVDLGFHVADAPQLWCEGKHLACNVRDAAMWEYHPRSGSISVRR